MKWRNHKIVSFSIIYSVTGSLIASTFTMIGSVLPDVLELGGTIQHRTVTHLAWLWLLICGACWMAFKNTGFTSVAYYLLFFCFVGGALHVFEDSLSDGGVPVLDPYGKKIGFGVYRTKTLSEELTVLGLVVLFTAFSFKKGYLAATYLGGQVEKIIVMISGLFTR